VYHGERFNSISHLVGATAAVAGTALLVTLAARQGDPWKIVAFALYGTTLILLYGASTLYHALRGRARRIFRRLDHLAIYLLIAGTYTPFTLVTLRGPWGWSIFGAVWGLALAGILVEQFGRSDRRILPVAIYLLMGWLCLVALNPLLAQLSTAGFLWLLAGGLWYSLGILFYALDHRVPHFHAIWHLFVLAGNTTHYFTILLYVL